MYRLWSITGEWVQPQPGTLCSPPEWRPLRQPAGKWIPVCQSCHIHIHRTDEPPYRQWHRQLYVEHRSVWNQHTDLPYNGPHLTRDLAERLYGDDGGTPEAVKYLDDDDDDEDDGSAGVTEVP